MTIFGIGLLAFLVWLFLSLIFYRPKEMGGMWDNVLKHERTKSNINFLALFFNIREGSLLNDELKNVFTTRTPLDKEIAYEKKQIKQLEQQKEKMDELGRLKCRKERLFSEVNGED